MSLILSLTFSFVTNSTFLESSVTDEATAISTANENVRYLNIVSQDYRRCMSLLINIFNMIFFIVKREASYICMIAVIVVFL